MTMTMGVPFNDYVSSRGTDVAIYDLYSVVARPGDQGEFVSEIQELLMQQGLDVQVTGVYDQTTVWGVKAFEEGQGMRVTGLVTNAMLKILRNQAFYIPAVTRDPDEFQQAYVDAFNRERSGGYSNAAKAIIALLVLGVILK